MHCCGMYVPVTYTSQCIDDVHDLKLEQRGAVAVVLLEGTTKSITRMIRLLELVC